MNTLFDNAKERLLKATLNWTSLSMVGLAYDLVYTFDPADLTQADIGTPVAVSEILTGLSVPSGGYAKSGTIMFDAIPVGPQVRFIVIAEANITPANRKLIAYIDQAWGLPFTPNGGPYPVQPDWLAAQGWFRA